jgi:hypothetical protein
VPALTSSKGLSGTGAAEQIVGALGFDYEDHRWDGVKVG